MLNIFDIIIKEKLFKPEEIDDHTDLRSLKNIL